MRLARHGARARVVLERVLHDAVLERVEADRGDPPADRGARQGGVEPGAQRAQLVVDGDAQRLEGARRGVDGGAGLGVRGPPDGARHDVGQVDGVAHRRAGVAQPDDRARDAARSPLLAELVDRVGDGLLVARGQEVGRALARGGIEPHVQRRGDPEREAALALIELHRAHAQIEQHAVHRRDAQLVQRLGQRREVAVNQGEPRVGQRSRARRGVRVERHQPARRAQARQDQRRMPARPERRVDVGARGPRSPARRSTRRPGPIRVPACTRTSPARTRGPAARRARRRAARSGPWPTARPGSASRSRRRPSRSRVRAQHGRQHQPPLASTLTSSVWANRWRT